MKQLPQTTELTPKEIVSELDKYIIGQAEAKRAVAVALRNRYRRSKLDEDMRNEVTPKNIIMMGPTGVGKTEIARRLAKLVNAPFVKVEATKFTEVGYVGRDVDSMVRDLVDAAVRLVKDGMIESVKPEAALRAEDRIIRALAPAPKVKRNKNPLESILGVDMSQDNEEEVAPDEELLRKREAIGSELKAGRLEEAQVEVEVEEIGSGAPMIPGVGSMEINMQDIMGGLMPKKRKKRRMSVREARRILEQEEANNLIDMDEVVTRALSLTENQGIIFIDEIDKIAGAYNTQGADVSREGVQRDILPLVEGSTVTTKYGPVKTDFMLFIAAGAFHVSKISDLIPELQGRFPIVVKLSSLSEDDFLNILTQPRNALIKQYSELLSVEKVKLNFTEDALRCLAHYAFVVNENSENLGARRLHTIMEGLLEEISYNAGGNCAEVELTIDSKYVEMHLKGIAEQKDVEKYII